MGSVIAERVLPFCGLLYVYARKHARNAQISKSSFACISPRNHDNKYCTGARPNAHNIGVTQIVDLCMIFFNPSQTLKGLLN